jgi:hypothetical protein
MPKPPETAIGCEATPEGRIKLFIVHKGKAKGSIEMPPEGVAGVVAALLIAAMKAAELSGQSRPVGAGASLAGIPSIVPTGIGLSAGEPPEPTGLVIHAGMARFGIALTNPRELGEALLATSADEGRAH